MATLPQELKNIFYLPEIVNCEFLKGSLLSLLLIYKSKYISPTILFNEMERVTLPRK